MKLLVIITPSLSLSSSECRHFHHRRKGISINVISNSTISIIRTILTLPMPTIMPMFKTCQGCQVIHMFAAVLSLGRLCMLPESCPTSCHALAQCPATILRTKTKGGQKVISQLRTVHVDGIKQLSDLRIHQELRTRRDHC